MTPAASSFAPMLASPANALPSLAGWTIEPKWDGYRLIADCSARAVHLWSRNGNDKAAEFPDVGDALRALVRVTGRVVLDGELIATDQRGTPLRFQALQCRRLTSAGADSVRTAYVAFDVLSVGRRDVRAQAWRSRRSALEGLIPKSTRATLRLGASSMCGSAGARRLIASARRDHWERLVVKRADAPYLGGVRSPLWRKVKFEHEQEFVIGCTLPTEGVARENFGALLIGYYDDDGALRFAGKVGTGYTRDTLLTLGARLARLQRTRPPSRVLLPRPPRRPSG